MVTKTRRTRRKTRRKMKRGGARMNIQYPSFTVNNSQSSVEKTSIKPIITLTPLKLSTFIMYDPDATVPQWVHYLVINIPNGNILKGDEVLSYNGPSPPSGIHRYIFEQLEQTTPYQVSIERSGFDIERFCKQNNLVKRAYARMRVGN